MNSMTKKEKIISEIIKRHDAITEAREDLQKAEREFKESWASLLLTYEQLDLQERVIAQDGAWVYEIKFDFEEYAPPVVTRIENWTEVHIVK